MRIQIIDCRSTRQPALHSPRLFPPSPSSRASQNNIESSKPNVGSLTSTLIGGVDERKTASRISSPYFLLRIVSFFFLLLLVALIVFSS
jgi:hypothetical protein